MIKKSMIALALATTAFAATPASATFSWWGGSSGGCKWGCTGSTSSSSSTSTSSSTSSSSSSSTSSSTSSTTGGSTTTGSTSGTPVPEPGMLGMFGLGLAGIAFGRRRMRRAAR